MPDSEIFSKLYIHSSITALIHVFIIWHCNVYSKMFTVVFDRGMTDFKCAHWPLDLGHLWFIGSENTHLLSDITVVNVGIYQNYSENISLLF